MTSAAQPLITRPGGYSAKNTHRAGAPNNHQGSGENPMVGTHRTATESAVTDIHDRLAAAGTASFLSVDHTGRCARINAWALAVLVAEILADHAAALRAERDAASYESDLREQEIIALTVERDRALDRAAALEAARAGAGEWR